MCLNMQLTQVFISVHNVEEIERPLAQSLEGWVLQQAVTGLMLGGQLEQAEALCSQVGDDLFIAEITYYRPGST